MTVAKLLQVEADGPSPHTDSSSASSPTETESSSTQAKEPTPTPTPQTVPWPVFLGTAKNNEIKDRFAQEATAILQSEGVSSYCCLGLIEPQDSIGTADLDAIFGALSAENSERSKDVLLLLLCPGGRIEPAFQISKICKAFSKERFVAVVPRQAKSAATLVAIGADEIHMGPLGHLGPIDPQLDGLPALGVRQALDTIASVAEKHPGSAELFARYLQRMLTVEQIGYCDRISESAVQYAERLLSTKPELVKTASTIAKELVYEYKDHSFVIDIEEARKHLGVDWIKTDTPEVKAAERMYSLFENVAFPLEYVYSKRLYIMGALTDPSSIRIVKVKK